MIEEGGLEVPNSIENIGKTKKIYAITATYYSALTPLLDKSIVAYSKIGEEGLLEDYLSAALYVVSKKELIDVAADFKDFTLMIPKLGSYSLNTPSNN
jgi:hypothetical protein